jgi:hypothetical protein
VVDKDWVQRASLSWKDFAAETVKGRQVVDPTGAMLGSSPSRRGGANSASGKWQLAATKSVKEGEHRTM